jgi:pimeloyl-ACP methyl ester carboxylesterase
MTTSKEYSIHSVVSKDGTQIGYRQLGKGPGVILIHGGLQASQNFMQLAILLSDNFTVYVPDRRGRGTSGPFGENYGIQKDGDDIDAILHKTEAESIFGLSSGAIIAMHAALSNARIQKLAVYEPPLSSEFPPFTNAFMPRYEKEVAEGKLADAFITIVKGLQVSGMFSLFPRFITVPLFRLALSRLKETNRDDVPLSELIPTFHFDNLLVNETAGPFERFSKLTTETLLINGSKSPRYLKMIIYKLKKILPNARHIELKGLDHTAADNGGKPEIVVAVLKNFFASKG